MASPSQDLSRAIIAQIKRCLPEMKRQLKKYDTTNTGSVRASQLMKVLVGNGIRSVSLQHLQQFATEKEGNDF